MARSHFADFATRFPDLIADGRHESRIRLFLDAWALQIADEAVRDFTSRAPVDARARAAGIRYAVGEIRTSPNAATTDRLLAEAEKLEGGELR